MASKGKTGRVLVEVISAKGKRLKTYREYCTGCIEYDTRPKMEQWALERIKAMYSPYFPKDAQFRVYH